MSTLYTRIGLHVSIALTLLSLCTVFAEGNKPDAPEEPASIEALAQEGRWEEVLAAAVRGLRDSPTDPRLLLWQVRAHRMRGRLARALTLCEKALAAAPTPELFTEQARVHAHMGAWQKCRLAAEAATKLRQDAVEPLLVQMTACREMGQWGRCRSLVDVAEKLAPNHPEVLLMEGQCLETEGKCPEAAAVLGQVVALRPDCAEAHYHLGLVRVRMQDSAKALEDFSHAIRLQPDVFGPYAARAELHERAGKMESAAADATLAIELGSRQSGSHLILARIAVLGGNWALAANAAAKAIELGARDAATCCLLGQAQRGQGLLKEAIESFTRALDLDPHCQEALLERAATHAMAAEYPHVIANCTQALAMKPAAIAYAMRGFARLRQREYDLAFEDSSNAVSLEPREATGLLVRASVNLVWGNRAEALRDCVAAQRIAPQLAWTHMVYGQALKENGQLEAALEQYERAVQLAPEDAEAFRGHGSVLAAMGKQEEAKAAFERAAMLDPAHEAETAPDLERGCDDATGHKGSRP